MARSPYKYVIKLTNEERQKLEVLVRNGKTERRLADRARMILWAEAGITIAETQHRLQCSEQIIINWRRDFLIRRQREGVEQALHDRPRSGRPPHFSPSAGGASQSRGL